MTLAGDADPVPMAERPIARAVVEATSGRECLARYAVMGRVLSQRILPLVSTLLSQAASGDPELRAFADSIESERVVGTGMTARHVAERFGLRPGLDVQHASDVLWALSAPELTDRLVNRGGWGWDAFEQWLGTTMADALLGPTG